MKTDFFSFTYSIYTIKYKRYIPFLFFYLRRIVPKGAHIFICSDEHCIDILTCNSFKNIPKNVFLVSFKLKFCEWIIFKN
jgi:hypothetical protein